MSSFTVSITNNSGYELTSSAAYPIFPGYIIPSFGVIPNNTTEEITITLDNPKDPCGCTWQFSIAGHPFKVLAYLNNPMGSDVIQLKFSAYYLEEVWGLSEIKLGIASGCAADKLKLTLPAIQLATIIP